MAGLRLGYAVTSPAIVDALRVVRLPYHLSALTQAAGVAALGHASTLLAPVADVVTERRLLQQWLADHGIPAADSSANFILIGPVRDSRRLFSDLRGRGVLVRETGGPGHLRVSIGTAEENEALRAALLDSGGWRT
jgi:histidinol-phosphate aminotransferase